MSIDATLLLLLAVCCWVLLALQASLWPRWLQLAAPLALVALLLATGDLASHTSMASILQWAANPQRRQDLAAHSFALVLAAISALLHWALPEMSVRHVLRVGLHGVQALAALWLARPVLPPSVDPVPLWGERLAATACVVLALAAVGWWWQRRR